MTERKWKLQLPEGEPLYTADVAITEDKYKRMFFAISRERLLWLDVDTCIILLAFGLLQQSVVFCVATVVLMQLVLWLMLRRKLHTYYTDNLAVQKRQMHYAFYADAMLMESASGQTLLRYADLKRIVEHDGSFYFIHTENSAIILDAADCPAELAEFLRGLPQPQPPKRRNLWVRVLQVAALAYLLVQVVLLAMETF